jgi:hypothetical protein
MARIRTIKPEFPHSESMGKISRDARLAFILMWTIADDSGRLRGNSRMLASLLFPYDEDAGKKIDTWIAELHEQGCVIRYKAENSEYIQIKKWTEHQRIDKPSPSKIPAFEEDSQIIREDSPNVPVRKGRERKGREGNGIGKEKDGNISNDINPLTPLPDWMPLDAWDGFCKMRGKTFTPHAKQLAINKLDEFRNYGLNPREILEQSIMHGWKGLFATQKGNRNENTGRNYPYRDKSAEARAAVERALGTTIFDDEERPKW